MQDGSHHMYAVSIIDDCLRSPKQSPRNSSLIFFIISEILSITNHWLTGQSRRKIFIGYALSRFFQKWYTSSVTFGHRCRDSLIRRGIAIACLIAVSLKVQHCRSSLVNFVKNRSKYNKPSSVINTQPCKSNLSILLHLANEIALWSTSIEGGNSTNLIC